MKKITRIMMLIGVASLFAVSSSNAQIFVRVRPNRPGPAVVVRTAPPSPRHVWVDEEWVSHRGRYVYRPGYWALPPRPGRVWVAGRWDDRPRGSVWISGHWR